jgi:alkylation response protein AidB-like acyl-CoA dehydrogenase
MDFQLSGEHETFRQSVRAFAAGAIAPRIRQLDAEERFDAGILRAMGDAGLLGTCIPRALGGQGRDYHSLAIACEEVERIDTFARVILSVHLSLNSLALLQWGTRAQQEKYLVPQARGERIAAFALTEATAGTDAAALQTRAAASPGGYRLSGEKEWIGLADVADQFLVFATGDPEQRHRGISAFIVEREFAGVTTKSIRGKLGIRAGNVGSIRLDNVLVPAENRLGEEGEGFTIAMSALDNGRYSVAAGSLGVIGACLEEAGEYARRRRTFGKEIGRHQLVQQMLARMVAGRDVGRLLVRQVGWMKNAGLRHTREVSLAKWLNCDAALQSASDAIEILGARGYSNEYAAERHFRNARAPVIYEGTREIHQVIQAEYALGYRQDTPLRCPLPGYPFAADREPGDAEFGG